MKSHSITVKSQFKGKISIENETNLILVLIYIVGFKLEFYGKIWLESNLNKLNL